MLDADDNVWFYEFKKDEAVVLESGAEEGLLLSKPEMQYTELEYGLHMMMDCLENDKIPETTIEDNINSLEMVSACLESAEKGVRVQVR